MATANEFAEQVHGAVEAAIVAFLRKGDWFVVDYARRVQVDASFLRDAFAAVDMARVKALVRERVEDRIADMIFNAMATEIATDVKQVMSNKELREDVRAIVREKIRKTAEALS